MADEQDLLQGFRSEIDELDRELVGLLARRVRIIEQVAEVKHAHGIPAALKERVEAVVENARRLAEENGIAADDVEAIYRLMIGQAIALEERRTGEA